MSRGGDADTRSALVVRLAAARESLGRHLAHEETEAIALMQQVMTEAEWQQLVADFFKPKKITWTELVNVLPWTTDGVPPAVRQRLFADVPGGPLIFALSRPGYERRERRAFAYAEV